MKIDIDWLLHSYTDLRLSGKSEVGSTIEIKATKVLMTLGVDSIDRFPDTLIWLKDANILGDLNIHNATFLVHSAEYDCVNPELSDNNILLISDNPEKLFLDITDLVSNEDIVYEINNSAHINPYSEIHREVYIGPNSIVGKCKIGKGSVLQSNNFIEDGVILHERVRLYHGAVIGVDNFGYEFDKESQLWIKYPQVGGVIVHEDVIIGANTTIAKGILENTIISKGVEIDNQCQIGYNVFIGEGSRIAANVTLSGKVYIGKNVWIAPGSVIKDGVIIGDNSFVGIGSVVVRYVPENTKVFGNPAKIIF